MSEIAGKAEVGFVAEAVATHRSAVSRFVHEFAPIWEAIGGIGSNDLMRSDIPSLVAALLQFKPDFVLELGRGWGTSTALFRMLEVPTISVCRSNEWVSTVAPALENRTGKDWTSGVDAIVGEIREQDYTAILPHSSPFWPCIRVLGRPWL